MELSGARLEMEVDTEASSLRTSSSTAINADTSLQLYQGVFGCKGCLYCQRAVSGQGCIVKTCGHLRSRTQSTWERLAAGDPATLARIEPDSVK